MDNNSGGRDYFRYNILEYFKYLHREEQDGNGREYGINQRWEFERSCANSRERLSTPDIYQHGSDTLRTYLRLSYRSALLHVRRIEVMETSEGLRNGRINVGLMK